ncbi:MAG: 4-hydroxy-3-methylbut-2-enyl diphosphate reductase [candidate division KSB1 bacterium]|nr:4-hydroxy-3-methylbut-2-enyl diphosphate reductase [candidate division KSB1 bacterium]
MKVVIDPNAGPCSGVRRALALLQQELQERGECYALGEVIHNLMEMERLEQAGLRTIDQEQAERGDLDSFRGRRLLIRAHGISESLRQVLKENEITIIDGTCPTVDALQKRLRRYADQGYQVVIVGKAGHPEVKGLSGACRGRAVVVNDERDAAHVEPNLPTVVAAQTTIAAEHFDRMVELLKSKVKKMTVLRSMCPQVAKREENIRNFAGQVTVLLLVGGKNSSNTRVLFESARTVNPRTIWIESPKELESKWFEESDIVGVTGSASTPFHQLEQVRDALIKSPLRGENTQKEEQTHHGSNNEP